MFSESIPPSLGMYFLVSGLDLLGILLLVAYQVYLARVCRAHPDRTYRGLSNRLRESWIAVMRSMAPDVLPIQTMRNWVMSATLLGSTAMLVGLGAAHVAFATEEPAALADALSLLPPASSMVIRIKLLILAGIFFSAFHDFALALRHYNHVGFMVNLPDGEIPGDPLKTVATVLNRAGNHFNFGNRKFLLAAPMALWLIGPIWFLGGVLLTIWVLYRFDFRRVGVDEAQQSL